jgi:hypothetical protein
VIAAHATKAVFSGQGAVSSIESLSGCPWWNGRSTSQTLDRKTASYLDALERIHAQANHLMFVDPYLDPSEQQYQEFFRILAPLALRNPKPRVELHRKSFIAAGSGGRSVLTVPEWQVRFAPLHAQLSAHGLSALVYIWGDFHDRYLLSDIVGLTIPHGFDVSTRPDDFTSWARLGRADREHWTLQYDEANGGNRFRGKFSIGV